MNRQTGPEVYDYNRGSYDGRNDFNSTYPPGSNIPSQPGEYRTVTTSDHYEQFGREDFGYTRTLQQPKPYWGN